MKTRLTELHNKEVINVKDGTRIGFVDDVEIDTVTAQVCAIVVFGKSKCFGLLGRENDIVIGWKDIEVIGEETVLVQCHYHSGNGATRKKGTQILGGIFQ